MDTRPAKIFRSNIFNMPWAQGPANIGSLMLYAMHFANKTPIAFASLFPPGTHSDFVNHVIDARCAVHGQPTY